MRHVEDELRESFPVNAGRADAGRSRAAAIRLHCLSCNCGSAPGVRECHLERCFLWPYRMGGAPETRPGRSVSAPGEAQEREQPSGGSPAPREQGGAR